MTVVIKLISAFFVCCLALCKDQNFKNFAEISSSNVIPNTTVHSEIPNRHDVDDQLSITSPSNDRKANEPLPCRNYYEYCTNPNTTYKFQTGLQGMKMPNYGSEQFGFTSYEKVRCSCDPNCHLYGDCCYDQLTIDNETGEPINIADPEFQWECHRVPFRIKGQETKDIDIMLVASCPSHYKDVNVIRMCQRDNVPSFQYNYIMDVPFISLTTNRTYVNIYCAMCNSDNKVHRWNMSINCSREVPNCRQRKHSWKYVRGENRWTIRQNNTLYNITYDINIDPNGKSYYEKFNARKCRPDVIRDCPADWSDKNIRDLCSAYSLLVQSISNRKIYKNEHCAVCNGQERSNHNLICPQTEHKVPPVVSVLEVEPFSILIDFYGEGDVGQNMPECDQQLCKFGEICDRLFGKCRTYTCGELFYMDSDGKCERNNVTEVDFSSPYLNDSCPKFHVRRPYYVSLPNNSIYVNFTSKTYLLDQHEVVNETTVLICADIVFYNFGKFSYAQSILSTIGVTISLLCLAIYIFLYLFLPQMHNLHGTNILSLSCCLFVAQLCFQFGITLENAFTACVAIGMTIHFGFLASFFWMNILAIDIYRTFASESCYSFNDEVWEKYRKYALYAWLTPLVIVVLALINDLTPSIPPLQPNYGEPLCWINNRDSLFVYFAGPLGLLLLVNMAFFWMTIVNLQKAAKVSKMARENSNLSGQGIANDRTRAILYAKLAVIMGLTWIFGFIAALSNATVLWYVFIIFNSLQGAFIFLAFSCKRSTFNQVQVKFYQVIGREVSVESNRADINHTQLTTVTPDKAGSSFDTLMHCSNWIGANRCANPVDADE